MEGTAGNTQNKISVDISKLCCCSLLKIGCAAINNQQCKVKDDEREV
jgi:hypothetical protein